MNLRFILCSKRGFTFRIHFFPLAVCSTTYSVKTGFFATPYIFLAKMVPKTTSWFVSFRSPFLLWGQIYYTHLHKVLLTVELLLDETLCIVSPVEQGPSCLI